jgi:hypothetical protein
MYYTRQALENVKTTWNPEQKDSESQLVIGCWMIFICHVFRKLNNRHLYNIRLNGWEVSLCCIFCFVFIRLVYHMLPVSLDCPFFDYHFGILYHLFNKEANDMLSCRTISQLYYHLRSQYRFLKGHTIVSYVPHHDFPLL